MVILLCAFCAYYYTNTVQCIVKRGTPTEQLNNRSNLTIIYEQKIISIIMITEMPSISCHFHGNHHHNFHCKSEIDFLVEAIDFVFVEINFSNGMCNKSNIQINMETSFVVFIRLDLLISNKQILVKKSEYI